MYNKKSLINFSKSCDGEMQISFQWPNVNYNYFHFQIQIPTLIMCLKCCQDASCLGEQYFFWSEKG